MPHHHLQPTPLEQGNTACLDVACPGELPPGCHPTDLAVGIEAGVGEAEGMGAGEAFAVLHTCHCELRREVPAALPT